MMNTLSRCPECGADWSNGQTCEDCFHQMLFWEQEDPAIYGPTHHLMILSYHLQHPHLYSPEGLIYSKGLLFDFLERGLSPAQVRASRRSEVDSGQRTFKIIGTPERHGRYPQPMPWTMTAADVVAAGLDRYVASIEAWARSIKEVMSR